MTCGTGRRKSNSSLGVRSNEFRSEERVSVKSARYDICRGCGGQVLLGNRKVFREEENELTLFREAKIEVASGFEWLKRDLSSYKSNLSYRLQK